MVQNDVDSNKFTCTEAINLAQNRRLWESLADYSGTPHSYTEVYAEVDDDDDGKVQYTVEMNTTHFKKLQSPNSWNRQVAYRQADGQNKLPTLSTN